MAKNLLKLLILLLTVQLSLATDNYPKKLIIQNSKGGIDTVIALTNEQVIAINQKHVILKQCIEYSNIQDSTIQEKNKFINRQDTIIQDFIKKDSVSKSTISLTKKMLLHEQEEKEKLKETFTKYQKQVTKQNRNTWLYTTFIIIPVTITLTSVVSFLITK